MRKKTVLLSVAFLIVQSGLYAQGRSQLGIHAGYLYPKDIDSSIMYGVMVNSAFDEAVDVGFGFDFFQKVYSERTPVVPEAGQPQQQSVERIKVDYSRTAVPLYVSIKVKIPTVRSRIFGYFIRANLSYQFLISNEKNYERNVSETRKYKGMGWQAGAGLFYRIGSRSTLIAEGLLNNCVVSRDVGTQTALLPMTERVNLSGIGVRAGVELDLR